MRKIYGFVLALLCSLTMSAQEVTEMYLVGDATPAGWSFNEIEKTQMTAVGNGVFTWTGNLKTNTGEGFKIVTQRDWNPGMHPSEPELKIDLAGSDVVALPYTGDPDTKWQVSKDGVYTITVTLRAEDALVECEYVSEIPAVDIGVPVVDGVWQIKTSAQLTKYAQAINDGTLDKNMQDAVMLADISIAANDWITIGTDAHKFLGTFDGQNHRIKGMHFDGNKKEQGFFGVVGAGALIKNLIMDASCNIVSTGGSCFAAFVGCCNNNGTITFENCGNEADITGTQQNNAAFVGCNYGGGCHLVFNNCYNTGKISGGWENGAFTGWNGGGATFNNCYNIAEITEGENWSRGNIEGMNNCYQTNGSTATQISEDIVATGELCYLLNGQESGAECWYQTIGTDAYPVPMATIGSGTKVTTHEKVYAGGRSNCAGELVEVSYANEDKGGVARDEHVAGEDGFCTACHQIIENFMEPVDGYYVLENAVQLNWFAGLVKTNGEVNAKLAANIDYTEYTTATIGTDGKPFAGEFDGQGHTITINICNTGANRTGLFAYVKAATIKNLVVEGTASSDDKNCVGGLGGRSDYDGTLIENVVVKTDVIYTGSNGDATCGGFFANMEGSVTLKDCAFLGTINSGTAEGNGGLVGWAGGGNGNKYINCVVSPASYTKNGNSAEFARNNPTVENCYYIADADASLALGTPEIEVGEEEMTITFAAEGLAAVNNASLCVDGLIIKHGDEIYHGFVNEAEIENGVITLNLSYYMTMEETTFDTFKAQGGEEITVVLEGVELWANPANMKAYKVAECDEISTPVVIDVTVGVTSVEKATKLNGKVLENGKVVILKNGVRYNTVGNRIK